MCLRLRFFGVCVCCLWMGCLVGFVGVVFVFLCLIVSRVFIAVCCVIGVFGLFGSFVHCVYSLFVELGCLVCFGSFGFFDGVFLLLCSFFFVVCCMGRCLFLL